MRRWWHENQHVLKTVATKLNNAPSVETQSPHSFVWLPATILILSRWRCDGLRRCWGWNVCCLDFNAVKKLRWMRMRMRMKWRWSRSGFWGKDPRFIFVWLWSSDCAAGRAWKSWVGFLSLMTPEMESFYADNYEASPQASYNWWRKL